MCILLYMGTLKKVKAVRGPQYESILNDRYGLSIRDCKIMGFRFKTMAEAYAFHFLLMNDGINTLLYDGATENVKIFFKEENPKAIELAKVYGGEYYKPTSLNDYE